MAKHLTKSKWRKQNTKISEILRIRNFLVPISSKCDSQISLKFFMDLHLTFDDHVKIPWESKTTISSSSKPIEKKL
jgi:hypothetical protein